MARLILIPLLAILHWSCEAPIGSKPTDPDELFKVTHDFDGLPIVYAIPVEIQWSEITIDNFKEFLIERAYINEDGHQWAIINRISDSLTTSYTDTIDDDVTYQYRVRVVDKNNQYIYALSDSISVPEVTSITVPDDYTSIQEVYETKFIDSGDMISVQPGRYTGHFKFLDKDVHIFGTGGPSSTVLEATDVIQSVVEINRGQLEGFKITKGLAFWGGGILAYGSARITNCSVIRNRAIESPDAEESLFPFGAGGGIFATDSSVIENCYIKFNFSNKSGGGIIANKMTTVNNCTIANNYSLIGGGLHIYEDFYGIIRNSRIDANHCYYGSGAGVYVAGGDQQILNCTISRNHSESSGGGIVIDSGSSLSIVNCVIYRNSTFYINDGAFLVNGNLQLINSIVWANSGTLNKKFIAGIAFYSNIQDISPLSVNGNIDLIPGFEDPEAGDFHLKSGSPCIDAGSPNDAYRDVDGSQNDMGIYGGPDGE